MSAVDVDGIIASLVENRRPHKEAVLREDDVRALLLAARDAFMSQPMLLEIPAPTKIAGDIHGQFDDLLRLFELCGHPSRTNYLFIGDYVDRGRYGIETVCLLFAYKLKYPDRFFLLRGNHECASINRLYGFYDECKRRFNVKLWKLFNEAFNTLPVACIVDDRIFCCHGGLSPDLRTVDQIRSIVRPCEVPDSGLLCDLMWAVPDETISGWQESPRRGLSGVFGLDIVQTFLAVNDLDLVCRSHEVQQNGYKFCGEGRDIVTIFSTPDYCGECGNRGAVMSVDESLICSFHLLDPLPAAAVGRRKAFVT